MYVTRFKEYSLKIIFYYTIPKKFFFLQEYSFQITLRQQWNDVRLKFKDKLQKGHEGKYYDIFTLHNCSLDNVQCSLDC